MSSRKNGAPVKSKVRLAYLANTPIPSRVASSMHVMRMCRAFANVGHKVDLVVSRFPADVLIDADPFAFFDMNRSFQISWLAHGKSLSGRLLKQHRMVRWRMSPRRYDFAYARCHSVVPYRVHRIEIPFVVDFHTLHDRSLLLPLLRNPNLIGMVFISEQLRQAYREMLADVPTPKFTVARDGADAAPECTPMSLPGRNRFRCGYIGSLHKGKGVELIPQLASRCPQVDFHVFGGSPHEISQWRNQDANADLKNLHFNGFIEPGKTEQARQACDVLIAPYQNRVYGAGGNHNLVNWMSPLKLFEYMASGKLVLTSNLPALREFLCDEETALLCPPDDLDGWVNRINWALNNRTAANEIAENGRKAFAENFSWDARAESITQEFFSTNQLGTETLNRSVECAGIQN